MGRLGRSLAAALAVGSALAWAELEPGADWERSPDDSDAISAGTAATLDDVTHLLHIGYHGQAEGRDLHPPHAAVAGAQPRSREPDG